MQEHTKTSQAYASLQIVQIHGLLLGEDECKNLHRTNILTKKFDGLRSDFTHRLKGTAIPTANDSFFPFDRD